MDEILDIARSWFKQKGWSPLPFQERAWKAYLNGQSGIVNAPTGSGKTYSILIPALLEFIRNQEGDISKSNNGLQIIWITPIRALSKEIKISTQRAIEGLQLDWRVGVRTGDTSTNERTKQREKPPEILITTPESLHLLLASRGYSRLFGTLKAVIADEWHELMGSKRGVQVELALSRFKAINPGLKIWGISATIGNMDEALQVLLGHQLKNGQIIKSSIEKKIDVETIIPDVVEEYSWGGHLGIKLLEKVVPIIRRSKTTLLFTNTRSQCEIWYQKLIQADPDLIGVIAMHHGSISREIRDWVEQELYEGKLKAVICTSSLDLGVDFRPVETIIQIGSAKGVARFMQRAGRSGHKPGEKSKIYFLPTHAMELMEGAALREAVRNKELEYRVPYLRSFDVLVQYLVTLACSEGFSETKVFEEIKSTFCYASMTEEDWLWIMSFVTTGGESLHAYNEYRKVIFEKGLYRVMDRKTALRHRLSIGTIVSDGMMKIKYMSGKSIGSIEEWFIAQLMPGDNFWFAGRSLELVRIKDMDALVKKSTRKTGRVPQWMGGKFPITMQLSDALRNQIHEASINNYKEVELAELQPLIEEQARRSLLPSKDQFLIEYFESKEGYHLCLYPFDGRSINEAIGTLLAFRISKHHPMSFSLGMNEYGVELLCNQKPQLELLKDKSLYSTENLKQDIYASINAAELAKRQFRNIAGISGLVFKGFPGKHKRERHLQSSSQLFFEVFEEYEPGNLLIHQAYDEALSFLLDEVRLRRALERISAQEIVITTPGRFTPFAFPIVVESLREKMSTERLEDRIREMKLTIIED